MDPISILLGSTVLGAIASRVTASASRLSPEAKQLVDEIRGDAEEHGLEPYDQWDDAREDYLRDYRHGWESRGMSGSWVETEIERLEAEVEGALGGTAIAVRGSGQGGQLYRAYMQSRSFDWEGYGLTPEEAVQSLIRVWNERVPRLGGLSFEEYVASFDMELGEFAESEMVIGLVQAGQGYVDQGRA